jgi:hypothetical protein
MEELLGQLLDLQCFKEAGETEMHTAEPLVPEPSSFGF